MHHAQLGMINKKLRGSRWDLKTGRDDQSRQRTHYVYSSDSNPNCKDSVVRKLLYATIPQPCYVYQASKPTATRPRGHYPPALKREIAQG